jgi:hypothetical protein
VPFPEPDICVFCRTAGRDTSLGRLSIEHAYPNWVSGELKPIGDIEALIGGRLVPDWKTFQVAIDAVCQPCNTGWLSNEFEKKVSKCLRPYLRNLTRPQLVLDQHQREVLGAWAVKTALMIELALAKLREPALTPERHFRWLYEHRTPPPGCTVWMFTVNIASGVGLVRMMAAWSKGGTIRAPSQFGEAPLGYFLTFTAGYVGFQVLGWDLDEAGLAKLPGPVRPSIPPAVQPALRQLWPAPRRPAFRWPWTRNGLPDGPVVALNRHPEIMDNLADWPWRPGLFIAERIIPAQSAPPPPDDVRRHDDAP